MAAKPTPAKPRKRAAAPQPPKSPRRDETYRVVLRTRGARITAKVQDRTLYPRAVAWNRLLTADRGRKSEQSSDRRAWQETGHQAIVDLAEAGEVKRAEVDAFITAAAKCGEVQVEMEWQAEDIGWAARVFPWEALIALATKAAREKLDQEQRRLVIVRMLRVPGAAVLPAGGAICFAVSAEVRQAGFDTGAERAAIAAGIAPRPLVDLPAETLDQLRDGLRHKSASALHYSLAPTVAMDGTEAREPAAPDGARLEDIARAVAAHHPRLVAFSSCHTGRRLAPLALVHGAQLAIGFHDAVMDASCPVFFGAFYREWVRHRDVLEALRQGLDAHHWQKSPSDLGGVTIWSATDLLGRKKPGTRAATRQPGISRRLVKPADIISALKITCELEKELNYSMLHNRRGGLFAKFDVLKLKPGTLDDLEITVKIDTGLDRPVECHFFSPVPAEPDRSVDFMERVPVPLGSELLRRRGEMLRGIVEVTVSCGSVRVYHRFDSIELPPCDEWKDDEAGCRFLPSFIFPRDPAVRAILTSAQPFLRALKDDVRASFDGYPPTRRTDENAIDPLLAQLRSIWGALQHDCRLDYANPPPSYSANVQRVRTPEEIMRSRRATCLELALLLASCWEHIGIHPVIFLTRGRGGGHAFAGYWADSQAWRDFFDPKKRIDSARHLKPADEGVKDKTLDAIDPATANGGGMAAKTADWPLRATHHLALISREVKAGHLVPVEATAVAKLEAFGDACRLGREQLAEAFSDGSFDGMIDVRTARDQRVTPLAIITEGIVA